MDITSTHLVQGKTLEVNLVGFRAGWSAVLQVFKCKGVEKTIC